MDVFNARKQRIVTSYTAEIEILRLKIEQQKTQIANLHTQYKAQKIEFSAYDSKLSNLNIEITNDERRIESCTAITEWLTGKALLAELKSNE